jgi:hypothetical protein
MVVVEGNLIGIGAELHLRSDKSRHFGGAFRSMMSNGEVLRYKVMSGEPNDANAGALVCSGCCTHAASPQAPPGGNAPRPHSFSELRD